MKLNIFWFRRDLRLDDNTALNNALKSNNKVLAVFIFDENIISELDEDDARVSFIYKSLEEINNKLIHLNSSILIHKGKALDIWKKIVKDFNVDEVFINKDYEPYAINRDLQIEEFLNSKGIKLNRFKDQVIHEENDILKNDGKAYTVYTPYKNKWLQNYTPQRPDELSKEDNFYNYHFEFPSLESLGFKKSNIEVKDYNLSQIESYEEQRNFPSLDSTSYLSPHLRFGTVSIRTVLEAVKERSPQFVNELIWREFFMQILYHFPNVASNNFKSKYDFVQWRNNETEFEKWCEGKTGYPIVDAGMRELNSTGYMHNRVRMICAGFLCKHLLIDWRWGEAYFAKKLLDYELSSNNGNWQWAAGTGCDAAPYFRVFNPHEQLKKFDSELKYVRKWVKEFNTEEYPGEIVEHSFARKRALEVYKKAL